MTNGLVTYESMRNDYKHEFYMSSYFYSITLLLFGGDVKLSDPEHWMNEIKTNEVNIHTVSSLSKNKQKKPLSVSLTHVCESTGELFLFNEWERLHGNSNSSFISYPAFCVSHFP